MRLVLKIFFPVLVLCLGTGIAYYLITFKPAPEVNTYLPKDPSVRVKPASLKTVSIPVFTRGSVSPSTQTQLAVEVAGTVKKVSPKLANGAFFSKGDVLLEVDDTRYRFEISQVQSQLAVAQERFDRRKDELEIDRSTSNRPPDLILPKSQAKRRLKEARAQLDSAKTTVELAKTQIEKTKLRAPFDGRVLKSAVGLGQILAPGAPVAQVYSVDVAEVRLPLTDRLLGLVDVPELYNDQKGDAAKPGPAVSLQMSFAGQQHFWQGEIIRSEGGLDPLNRLLYLVAEIKDPYARDPDQPGRPPLTQGRFLEAKIEGVVRENVAVLPRAVVRYGNQVWVVDESERLIKREVEVLHKGKEVVYVISGICLLYTSPSPRDRTRSRMPSSA